MHRATMASHLQFTHLESHPGGYNQRSKNPQTHRKKPQTTEKVNSLAITRQRKGYNERSNKPRTTQCRESGYYQRNKKPQTNRKSVTRLTRES